PRGPDPAAASLLAARLETVGRILDVDGDLVHVRRVERSEIEREMGVAAGVAADELTVDANLGSPVDSGEAQQHVRARPLFRHAETPPVTQVFVDLAAATDAGQLRLERERHDDRLERGVRLELDLPRSVQAQPPRADF